MKNGNGSGKKFLFIILMGIFSLTFIFSQVGGIGEVNCHGLMTVRLSNMDITSPRVMKISKVPRIKESFSARDTLNIYVNFYWNASEPQKHVLLLKFYTPGGFLYLKEKFPVAIKVNSPDKMEIPGYRFPLKVRRGKGVVLQEFSIDGTLITPFVFPVGGTYIGKNKLFGRWKLEIFIDGNKTPCGEIYFNISE